MTRRNLLLPIEIVALSFGTSAQTIYTGNGQTGFGAGRSQWKQHRINDTFLLGTIGFGGKGLVF